METKDLENAIQEAKESAPVETPTEAPVSDEEAPKLSPEEEKGFHKGALNVLIAERNELVKMIANVEAIMQAHISRLKELGVEFN